MPVDRYPGLHYISEAWEQSPWTRVSFGLQWVIEPEGRYPLTIGIRAPKKYFGDSLEQALKRFIAIRSHPRGSEAEGRAIRELQDELRAVAATRIGNDPYERTREIFQAATGDLTKRFPGVFEFPDPEIRAHAAQLLGTYAEREEALGFRPGGEYAAFGHAVAGCLDDEDPRVRAAAAVAVHRILGRPAPEADPEELVRAATRLWTEAEPAAGAEPLEPTHPGEHEES